MKMFSEINEILNSIILRKIVEIKIFLICDGLFDSRTGKHNLSIKIKQVKILNSNGISDTRHSSIRVLIIHDANHLSWFHDCRSYFLFFH